LIAALVVAISSFSIASAHSRPVRFDPTPGAVLSSAPSQVTGWFTSDLRRDSKTLIEVQGVNGTRVDDGNVILSANRRQMSVGLQSGLPEGRYLVYWSTFDDADGEVFDGCHTFFVGQTAADAAIANAQAMDGGADCPATSDDHSDGGMPTDRTINLTIDDVSEGDDATLHISAENFTARQPDGSTRDPKFGHYHVYLDKWPIELLSGEAGHSHDDEADSMASHSSGASHDSEDGDELLGGMKENPAMSFKDTFNFTDLTPGVHTVTVALTYDDHSIMDPPVLASTSFTVRPADGGDDNGGVPAWVLALGVVASIVAGGGAMRLIGTKS
jgi:methionine-rich copper-binding protein CopC